MKYNILNRYTNEILFTAEINCDENKRDSIKKRFAVKWAVENNISLENADLKGADLYLSSVNNFNFKNVENIV